MKKSALAVLAVLFALGLGASAANAGHDRARHRAPAWTAPHNSPHARSRPRFSIAIGPQRFNHRGFSRLRRGHRFDAPPLLRRHLLAGTIARLLLGRHGFRIDSMRLYGGNYHARARNRYGYPIALVIDPFTGTVLRRHRRR